MIYTLLITAIILLTVLLIGMGWLIRHIYRLNRTLIQFHRSFYTDIKEIKSKLPQD